MNKIYFDSESILKRKIQLGSAVYFSSSGFSETYFSALRKAYFCITD